MFLTVSIKPTISPIQNMKPTIYANAFCSLVPSKLEKGIRINDKADMRNDITLYSKIPQYLFLLMFIITVIFVRVIAFFGL